MIDLHTHTSFSDGSDSVEELLKKAEAIGIKLLSITDHDSVDAYEVLSKLNISDFYKGEIVSGVEIKTAFQGIAIEILGYGIDPKLFSKSKCVDQERLIATQNKYLDNYKLVGKKLGLIFDETEIINSVQEYAATKFYTMIIDDPYNKEVFPLLETCKYEEFYRITSGNKNSPFYINEENDSLNINYVIDEIHRCGGKAFLAHLYLYKIDGHIEFLKDLIDCTNLDGVECYYSTFTSDQIIEILEVTNKYGLYVSGGTDYHGTNKPTIHLGIGLGNLNVPEIEINKWLKD